MNVSLKLLKIIFFYQSVHQKYLRILGSLQENQQAQVVMALTVSDLSLLLENISISSEPKSSLEELKNVLSTLHVSHIQDLGEVDLRVLFDCLNSSNREQVDTCAEILNKLLCTGHAAANVCRYAAEMNRALTHPADGVKMMVLKQVERCTADNDALEKIKQHIELLSNVISCIGSNESSVAAAAVRVVTSLVRCGPEGAQLVFTEPLLRRLTEIMASSDVVRYRGYEVAVSAAASSRLGMKLVVDSGLLPRLIGEAFGDDLLVRLTALELLAKLATTEHGFDYLEADGFLKRLEQMLMSPENNPLHDYIIPGVMKFFAEAGHVRPDQVLRRYPGFVHTVVTMVCAEDCPHRLCALDSLATLGLTAGGKRALHALGSPMTECMSQIGRLIESGPTEIRVRALLITQHLLSLPDCDRSRELISVVEAWLAALGPRPVQTLWRAARQPFPELRVSALRGLAAIAALPAGQRLIAREPGFLEYLLDRSTESTQEGRDAKYAVVSALVSSESAGDTLPEETLPQLVTYHRQGALYVSASTQLALDGSS